MGGSLDAKDPARKGNLDCFSRLLYEVFMSSKTPAKPAASRDDRLKAALKANMARRKAQTRARTARHDDADTPDAGEKTEKDKP